MPRLSHARPTAAKSGARRASRTYAPTYAVVRGTRNPSPLMLTATRAKAEQVARWLRGHFPGAAVRVQNAAPLTKSVGGREIERKWFAYVGDPMRTATWKLPIKSASHVRDALARFDQTELPPSQRSRVLATIRRRGRELGIHYKGER